MSEDTQRAVRATMPKHFSFDRFMTATYQAFERSLAGNKSLYQCTADSIKLALMELATLGLYPDGRQAALIPYGTQAQAQVDYKGLVTILLDSKEAMDVHACVTREGDVVRKIDRTWTHQIDNLEGREEKAKTGVFVEIVLANGYSRTDWAPWSDVEKARSKSKSAYRDGSPREDSPWWMWEDEMAKKFLLKRQMKTLRVAPEKAAVLNEQERREFEDLMTRPVKVGEHRTKFGNEGLSEVLSAQESQAEVAEEAAE